MSSRTTVAVGAALLVLASGTISAAALDGLTLQPSAALAGTSVAVIPDFKFAQGCAAFWDGTQVASAAGCGNAIPLDITASGAPGTHTVVLCTAGCDGADAITESAPFVVDELVPPLSGSPLGAANEVLAGTGLVGLVTGSPDQRDTVVGSVPTAGAEIAPGGTVQLLASAPPPAKSVSSTVVTSTVDHTTVQSTATSVVSSTAGPTQQRSTVHSGVLPLPPNRKASWALVSGSSLAALLVLAALAWWIRRRAMARAGRHVRPHPVAAPARVSVTTRDARASVRLERDPRRARTVDVRITRRTTVELTKEVGHVI